MFLHWLPRPFVVSDLSGRLNPALNWSESDPAELFDPYCFVGREVIGAWLDVGRGVEAGGEDRSAPRSGSY